MPLILGTNYIKDTEQEHLKEEAIFDVNIEQVKTDLEAKNSRLILVFVLIMLVGFSIIEFLSRYKSYYERQKNNKI